jgi:ADP-ribose pyrophosphatase YjhB (NUDIX family)
MSSSSSVDPGASPTVVPSLAPGPVFDLGAFAAATPQGRAWAKRLQDRVQQPPVRVRAPLWGGGVRIGSIEPETFARLSLACLRPAGPQGMPGWTVEGPLTPALAQVAQALRDDGQVRAWRDERLAVRGPDGQAVGAVERGVVRLLGTETEAVHLLGLAPDGRHWVQQRALNKADDPGLWDTMVGGMVPAGESVATALARETGEEAGLSLAQLKQLQPGGWVRTERPHATTPGGYVVERLAWFRCTVPDGLAPVNQDGEVAQFRLMDTGELRERLLADEFTLDAALMLLAAGVQV